jgi:glycerate kinase
VKIVIAPDSFKGSISAPQACAAMEAGARRACPNAEIVSIPLADGGEGTFDALMQSANGKTKTALVRNPNGQLIKAQWGFLPDGRAVIETARAAGLGLVEPAKRDAMTASTHGVGQLINAALKAGCRQFLIGLGGSATTDGGAGALTALGARFRDQNEVILRPGGAALANLATIDLNLLHNRAEKMSFTLLCDVENPLCGPNGAARVYAPQKGASPVEVEVLDAALSHFAALSAEKLGRDFSLEPGAGAAGGLAFGLMAYRGAKVRSGIEEVLEATDFAAKLRGADLVLTGEGALDAQTLSGKVIAGVCRAAREQNVPVWALAGKVVLSESQLEELGVQNAISICPAPRELSFCLDNAALLLEETTERALSEWR